MWRNRSLVLGGAIVAVILISAVFAPLLTPYSPTEQNYTEILQPMSAHHWLGTDPVGRDILSRILIGARTSMEVSFGAVAIGMLVGIPVGLFSGFYGGFMDNWVIMRVVDALQAFPFLILALVLAAMLGPGIGNAMFAIAIGYLPIFIRITRGQVIAEMNKDYVEAAKMVGASPMRIMFKHILRNVTTPLIVQGTIAMASGIVAEASLSYLGLGPKPPTASWGTMIQTAQGYMSQAPWFGLIPGFAIVIAVLGFNMLGEGLQDLWNPRNRNR
ncbi:ABC transporter permease [Alicyclobacillus sp. SO9]|nr:ABC transporter permease [Alicyclobacillus sp. SO9]